MLNWNLTPKCCRCIEGGIELDTTIQSEGVPQEGSGGGQRKKKRSRRSKWAAGVATSARKKTAKKKILCSEDEDQENDAKESKKMEADEDNLEETTEGRQMQPERAVLNKEVDFISDGRIYDEERHVTKPTSPLQSCCSRAGFRLSFPLQSYRSRMQKMIPSERCGTYFIGSDSYGAETRV